MTAACPLNYRADQLSSQRPLILVFLQTLAARREARLRGADATIAATYAMFVTDLGLPLLAGALTVRSRPRQAPPDWVPVAVLPIGYAAETLVRRPAIAVGFGAYDPGH